MKRKEISDNDYYILSVLALKPLYGYAIRNEIKQITNGRKQVSLATLYDALHRLLRQKFIESDGDQEADGRIRRTYRITGLGMEAVQERNHTVDLVRGLQRLRLLEG